MRSKFKWTAWLTPIIFVMMFSAFTASAIFSFLPEMASAVVIMIPGMACVACAMVWLIFGEFRTKMIEVELAFDHLTIGRYLGLAAPKTYYYTDLDGFTICILPASSTAYEYLYIKQNGKNIGKLSEFYHANYTALKDELEKHIKYIDVVDFSYWVEVKDIFS
jgi:hypothetical protein